MPVVNVETPKKVTVPKSAKVSIPTKLSPIKMAGLAEGKITLKKISKFVKPKFLPTSIRFLDWLMKEDLVRIKI